jgi:excisionase family DNA binding protein
MTPNDVKRPKTLHTYMTPQLYTPSEVAARLKVTERTITSWIRLGKMQARKVGRSYRISENGIDAFLGDVDAFFQTLVEAVPEE